MDNFRIRAFGFLPIVLLGLSACATGPDGQPVQTRSAQEINDEIFYGERGRPQSSFFDLFRERPDSGQIGAVNKYLWNASIEVLNFLPVQSVDPFTGVITTGFGTPPGGGRAYRATILVSDPALDARSLNVAIMTRSGAADTATVRAVEDAILTRARQLRQRDTRF